MKYLAAFVKGSRQCVGMELGKAEIMTALGMYFPHSIRTLCCYGFRQMHWV